MSADSLTEISHADCQKFMQAMLDVNRFTKRELADRLGVTHGTVNNWFIAEGKPRSGIKPSRDVFEKIAELLNTPVWKVVRMIQEGEMPEPLSDRVLISKSSIKALANASNKDIQELANQMNDLPSEQRMAAIVNLSNALMRTSAN